MAKELQVISDCYDLIRYFGDRIEKFPRQLRYSLGVNMEQQLQSILAQLIRAKYTRPPEQKITLLTEVNVELEVFRFQVRLAHDRKALAHKSHHHGLTLLTALGTQVGGWLKSLRPKT